MNLNTMIVVVLGAAVGCIALLLSGYAYAGGTCNDKCADTFTVPEVKVCNAAQVSRTCVIPNTPNQTILCPKCYVQEPQHEVPCSAAGHVIHKCCDNVTEGATCYASECKVTGVDGAWVKTCVIGTNSCSGSQFQFNRGTCTNCVYKDPDWNCPGG